MSRIILIFTCFLFAFEAEARLLINVSMVYKNGIDKNLVLESEIHSVEEVDGKKYIKLDMKNGAKLRMQTGFWERPVAKIDSIGPSSQIYFEGKVYKPNGDLAKEVRRINSQIELGSVFVIDYSDKNNP